LVSYFRSYREAQAWLSRKRRHIGVYMPGYLSFQKINITTGMSRYNMSAERGNCVFARKVMVYIPMP